MVLDIIVSSSLIINIEKLKGFNDLAYKTLKQMFTYKNPKFLENEKWGYSNYTTPKHLYSYEVKDGKMYISRGGLERVVNQLQKFNIKVKEIDRTLVCSPIDFNQSNTVLRIDQEKYINEMLQYNGGCGQAYTSFGKTVAMLELAAKVGQPTLILVHTTFLQEQWINEAINNKLFNLNPSDIGGVGGLFGNKAQFDKVFKNSVKNCRRKFGKLNICLYQSMVNEDHLNYFKDRIGLLLFDEGQKSPIEGIQQVVNNFRARYRFTVSADLRRKDGKHFLTFDTFGPVRSIVRETNSDSKILSDITLVPTKYSDEIYSEDQNYSGLITRMGQDKNRNILICRRAIKKVREDKLVMIFVERKEQAGILAKMLSKFRVDMLTGSMDKKSISEVSSRGARKILENYDESTAYNRIKLLTDKKKLDIIIGTQKAEVGLSIRPLDHLIITTPAGGNPERFKQIKGRVERTYSTEQEEYFGFKKSIPTIDVLVDYSINSSRNAADTIKELYGDRVSKVKSVIRRRK